MALVGVSSVVVVAALLIAAATWAEGFISDKTWRDIRRANRDGGPFVGLVVPNAYEMDPILNSPSFSPSKTLNAGLTTQLLMSLFKVKGIVHWGIAGNANEDLQNGDVTIAEHWAHLSLWNWQRHGDGPQDELSLEAAGDYTREFGALNFSDYTVGSRGNPEVAANTLNGIWYQPEEVFPVSGEPEQRQHAFWVPASKRHLALARKLEGMEMPACVTTVNATKQVPAPRATVVRVARGCSSNVFLDNAAYRRFIRDRFGCAPVEMESAAVAPVAHQHAVPFLTIRSLSDLAGGGSELGNEVATSLSIAAQNAVDGMLKFVPLLGGERHADAGRAQQGDD